MADVHGRRSWFGLGGRPRLPAYLRPSGLKRIITRRVNQPARMRVRRGKRLKGLDEFEKPEFVGRMARVARRKKLEWWAMVAAFALGGAIGWWLI